MTTPLTAEQKAIERMAQAYPTLSAFYSKHAIGSMVAPSCFGCGHVGERSTTHFELPDVYLCTNCVEKIRGR